MKFRLSKCVQYEKESILWQVQSLRKNDGFPKKFFLKLSYKKDSGAYLSFLKDKPSLKWSAQGAFSSLVRKYLPTCLLSEIYKDDVKKLFWIPLQVSSKLWFLVLNYEGAVEISLQDPEGLSLVRLGVKGLFTKKKEGIQPELLGVEHCLEGLLKNVWEAAGDLSTSLSDFGKASSDKLAQDDGSLIETDLGEESNPSSRASLSDEALPKSESEVERSPTKPFISSFQRDVRRKLVRKRKILRKSAENASKSLISDEQFKTMEEDAKLLQAYIYKVENHSDSLKLSPEETGREERMIPLDPLLKPRDNLNAYFNKLKKIKRGRQILAERYESVKEELENLENICSKLDTGMLPEAELFKIMKTFKISLEEVSAPKKKQEQDSLPYRVYKSSEGSRILVGKGPAENDLLTKSARSNDFWFHTIVKGGSHVIIPFQELSKKKELSAKLKREASILALHFSKLRKDQSGDLYVTQRAFLTKKKGLAPGLWIVQKAETFHVSYEEEELREILNRT